MQFYIRIFKAQSMQELAATVKQAKQKSVNKPQKIPEKENKSNTYAVRLQFLSYDNPS